MFDGQSLAAKIAFGMAILIVLFAVFAFMSIVSLTPINAQLDANSELDAAALASEIALRERNLFAFAIMGLILGVILAVIVSRATSIQLAKSIKTLAEEVNNMREALGALRVSSPSADDLTSLALLLDEHDKTVSLLQDAIAGNGDRKAQRALFKREE